MRKLLLLWFVGISSVWKSPRGYPWWHSPFHWYESRNPSIYRTLGTAVQRCSGSCWESRVSPWPSKGIRVDRIDYSLWAKRLLNLNKKHSYGPFVIVCWESIHFVCNWMPLFNAVLVGHIFLYILFPWIIFNAVLVSLISMCILFLCIFCGNALEQSELFRPGAPDLKQHIGGIIYCFWFIRFVHAFFSKHCYMWTQRKS